MLGDDERWRLLRRCLRDDSVGLRLRVAGALVLLYGQIPTRIVELTADNVTNSDTDTYLQLKDQPVLLRPPLAALTLELAHRSTDQQPTGSPAWLFPGNRPGAHLYPGRLSTGLNHTLGIFIRVAAPPWLASPPISPLQSSLTYSDYPSPPRHAGPHSPHAITPPTSPRA